MTDIVVISTARNAEKYADGCISSVAEQSYRAAKHFYIDAASTDDTREEAVNAANGDPDIHVIRKDKPYPLLANIVPIINALPPDCVVAWVDGDDALMPGALERVAREYDETDCLVTYGQFEWMDGTKGFAAEYPRGADYRKLPWLATHLKTFKAGLFQQIPHDQFATRKGKWLELAVDLAVMFPLLELSGGRHRFIPDVLYRYNSDHSYAANASLADREYERLCDKFIRSKPNLTKPIT